MDMKRFFLYFITIAALALAGCGGGGGTSSTGSSLQDQLDLSQMEVARLTGELMTAKDEATRLQGLIDASPTKPELQAQLALAEQQIMDLEERIAVLSPPGDAPNAMSNAIVGGIVNPTTAGDLTTATGTDAANRPGKNSTSDTDTDEFVVTEGSIGTAGTTSIGTDDLGVVVMVDEAPAPGEFTPKADSETTLGDFAGSMYERTVMGGGRTDTITVYTNEGDPGDQAFATYYSVADRDGVTGVAHTTTGAVDINNSDVAGNSGLFNGSGFPTGANTFMDTPGEDDPATDGMENMFSGMFNGVSGTYTCTLVGGNCRAINDGDGNLAELTTGVWSFTPADLEPGDAPHMVQGVVHDSNYLSFGYWVQATTDEDDMTTYGVGTFYDGATSFAEQLDTLEGSASYSGNAAGMYGKKTFKHDGSVATLTTGDFTADANLMATFGGDDVAINAQYKLSGSVTNLMDDGTMVDPAWTVEFNETDLDRAVAINNFSGTTTGGGNYRGSFYGPAVVDDAATLNVDESKSGYPTGVAGDFTGHFANGHVIGAFGATR